MKEIRHYTKRIIEFPIYLIDLNSLSPDALWNDTLTLITKKFNHSQQLSFVNWTSVKQDKNLLGLHAILCYLLPEVFIETPDLKVNLLTLYLRDTLPNLSKHVSPYTEWMRDGERSEELVRSIFSALKILPANETEKYFQDRMRSIDTLERIKILEESKKARERAQEILRQIKQAEEEEAASKYNRE
jgi:hypothetical protein